MDSGLSSRVEGTLKALLPVAAPPYRHNSTTVDLSTAQNEVIRPELLQFFKSTVEDQVTSEVSFPTRIIREETDYDQVFALPAPNGGDPHLRKALASFFNSYFRPIHCVKPEHIVLTAGTTDAIETLIHTICDDGDSVLVPGPSWRKSHAHLTLPPETQT
jgi:aspartate/methionine/tyrosine aminotransferase